MNKSINASHRQEMGFIDPYTLHLEASLMRFERNSDEDKAYWALNAPASGVNPTHSTERAVG